MRLEDTRQYLGWPRPEDVTHPAGGGPGHYARLVDQKIGLALARRFGLREEDLCTGVLAADPYADTAEAPLAVVCQFSHSVGDDVLREAHRLCWNFSRTALLVTLEPSRIQAWTCGLAPGRTKLLSRFRLLPDLPLSPGETPASLLQTEAAQALHWVNLVSGEFLRQHPDKFRKKQRADALLVSNLRAVRKKLLAAELDRDDCHALLARLIFTQYLFQRTDSDGRPAINQATLDARFDGCVQQTYEHGTAVEHILEDKEETYALFRWLNQKFNGDLFPGTGRTADEREREWLAEKDRVRPDHLRLLSEFVSGRLDVASGQRSFWPEYSFDTLPLEFISSVYEEFLNEDQHRLSAYYTPPHLVDFVLDGVLPWGGDEWDLHILDPCCGSGIFLVKAFQRLVQRWRNAHPDAEPRIDDLRGILEKNLLGVDASGEAVRVASFSLCLALCDAIDPKHYWKRTIFPPLRNVRLIESDFFAEDHEEFRTKEQGEERTWDLVVGNAPWRGGELADDALGIQWATKHGWPVTDKNAGPLFLAKAAALTKPGGRVAMIQPAASLLYQRSWEPSAQLRKKLFSSLSVEEVVSFVHLRWQLFKSSKSPTCLVTLQPTAPRADARLTYICPKLLYSSEDDAVISVERHDIHEVTVEEAIHDPVIWTVLLLGQRRDVDLIRRLRGETTLRKLKAEDEAKAGEEQVLLTREGIIRGKSNQRDESQILERRILENPNFPMPDSLELDADALLVNMNPKVDHAASTDFSAFELPQLIVKQSILKSVGKFQAQLVKTSKERRGIICTQSYVTVHQFRGGDGWLRSACLAFRSHVSAYFLALTSRLAFDRAEALSGDMLDVPIPPPIPALMSDDLALLDVDTLVEQAFGLNEPERALISDLLEFGYREGGRKGRDKPGRDPTLRGTDGRLGDLYHYADFFIKTLRATFGKDKAVRATIFEEAETSVRLPARMIAIHLDWPQRHRLIVPETMLPGQLRAKMEEFYRDQLGLRTRQGALVTSGLGFQRVARLFISHRAPDGSTVPTVLFLKPDKRRYWTRSQALRDADELAAAIMNTGQRRRTEK